MVEGGGAAVTLSADHHQLICLIFLVEGGAGVQLLPLTISAAHPCSDILLNTHYL